MKKFYPLLVLLFLMLLGVNANAQRIILYQENFNNTNTFNVNTGGPANNNGPNNWIVNNNYNGNNIYPNTPDESNTFGGGGISGQPNSPYLHIHDSNAPAGTANANYDTSAASDNFAQIADICTQGYDTVNLVFYYIEEGSATDFGQLYYSIDGGGSWVEITPQSPLVNTNGKWKYVSVSNPIFANQVTLRFGWRWTNTGASTPRDVSLGIDDIFVVGAQNPLTKPTLTISNISPSTICLGGNGLLNITLSKALCDGSYSIALSDAKGNFNNGVLSYNGTIGSGQTTTTLFLPFPYSLAEGSCYKIRVTRSNPPFITSNTTACFTLKNCGDSIQTQQPAVLIGPDTACTKSVIDVPFWSYGKYYNGNSYIAQLSDANGSFANPKEIGRSTGDSANYDPAYVLSPGSVSGKIPDVPPGCGYYIRVVSTKPVVDPLPHDYYGPFCLRRCDILTDSSNDIHVCVTPSTGEDATITLTINQWDNNAKYAPGDSFLVQVLDSKYFSILNTGSLGVVVTNKSGKVTVSVPDLPKVIALLGAPGTGMYYIRLIALHSSTPWNTYGTLVRLVIGSVNPPGSLLLLTDTLFCTDGGGLVTLLATPPDPDMTTKYQWQFDPRITFRGINEKGEPFYSPFPPPYIFSFNFGPPADAGYYWFTVRAVNNGCFSPWWDTVHLRVIPTPSETILGPNSICQKDTVTFNVKFTSDTYYKWGVTNGRAVDTSNNIFRLICDSLGKATLTIEALNTCGHGSNSKTITINPKPEVTAGNDTTVCIGQTVRLSSSGYLKGEKISYSWTDPTAIISTDSITLVNPTTSQLYVVQVTSSLGCKDKDTVNVNVYPMPDISIVKRDITCYGDANGELTATAAGSSPFGYTWNTTPAQNTPAISDLFAGTYNVTVTDAHGCTADTGASVIQPQPITLKINHTEVSYDASDGTATVITYGGAPPFTYNWSTVPAQYGAEASGLAPGTYQVTVTDVNGCTQVGYVTLVVKKNALYVPNAFSPNGDGVNDVLDYFGVNLKEIYMAIYNRWGQKVFETSHMDERWNGTYKGQPESVGAYAYYIEATYEDGSKELKKGNVTIIR